VASLNQLWDTLNHIYMEPVTFLQDLLKPIHANDETFEMAETKSGGIDMLVGTLRAVWGDGAARAIPALHKGEISSGDHHYQASGHQRSKGGALLGHQQGRKAGLEGKEGPEISSECNVAEAGGCH
jgi:hypothetical protein